MSESQRCSIELPAVRQRLYTIRAELHATGIILKPTGRVENFFLIDTGGFIPDTDSGFNKEIRDQILFAIRESDEVIFTVDANEGIHPVDFEFARLLRKYLNDKTCYPRCE